MKQNSLIVFYLFCLHIVIFYLFFTCFLCFLRLRLSFCFLSGVFYDVLFFTSKFFIDRFLPYFLSGVFYGLFFTLFFIWRCVELEIYPELG